MRRILLIVILSVSVSVLYYAGCGGGSSGRSISLGGVVMAPTVSGSISVPPKKGLSKAVSDAAAEGVTCTVYTIEGKNLGQVTTAGDGSFSLTVALAALKGAEDTESTWSEPVIVDCNNGIQLYAEVGVDEESPADVDLGNATFATTLSSHSLAGNISGWDGWGNSYKSVQDSLDMTCLYDAMNALWDNAGSSGEGIADDNGYLKDAVMAFMAAGNPPSSAGYSSWPLLIQAVLKGEISSSAWAVIAGTASDYIGIDADTLANAYGGSYQIFAAVNNVFGAQFAFDGYGTAALANIASGDTALAGISAPGSVCEGLKAETIDGNAFIRPILASSDLNAFSNTYGMTGGIVVHFGLLKECLAGGNCSYMAEKPGAFFGYMNAFGGDFSDLWDGSAFNSTPLSGSFLAARSCNGSTLTEMKKCAEALNKMIYTGAGGDWNNFMTGGSFDEKKFGYWGGYFTGQATAPGFDPDSLDYTGLWSALYGGTGDDDILQGVIDCVNEKIAAGNYDTSSCFADIGGYTIPADITGTFANIDYSASGACDFSGFPIDSIVVSQSDSAYSFKIYYDCGGMECSVTYEPVSYDTSTGEVSYLSGADSFNGLAHESSGYKMFKFTEGTLYEFNAVSCASDGNGRGTIYYYYIE